jgi:hypothetical protein
LPPSDDDNDDAGLLENPLPARPTHLKRGGGGPEIRRPSGPKDDAVFFVVNMYVLRRVERMAHEEERRRAEEREEFPRCGQKLDHPRSQRCPNTTTT